MMDPEIARTHQIGLKRIPILEILLYVLFVFLLIDPPALPRTYASHISLSYIGAQVLRLPSSALDFLESEESLQDFQTWSKNRTHVEIIVHGDKLQTVKTVLSSENIYWEVSIPDIQRLIDNQKRKTGINARAYELAEDDGSNKQDSQMNFNDFNTYQSILNYLSFIGENYSNRTNVTTIGYSYEGRPIQAVTIYSGKKDAKGFIIDGGIHAREWISPAAVMSFLRKLVEDPESLGNIFSKIDFHIVPVLNPDGFEYSNQVDRLWRKNRRSYTDNCIGADLNRNFDFDWGGLGASRYPCQDTFCGEGALSEPEAVAFANFIGNINPLAYISVHCYGEKILFPYGNKNNNSAPDAVELERIGRKAAQAILSTTGAEYSVGNTADTLYPASGGSDDYAKGKVGVKFVYTFELGDKGEYGFLVPANYITNASIELIELVRAISEEIIKLP